MGIWFPGANLSHKAPVDGGSILGGRPKCLWHDTETNGLPSYSTNYWPNMTICDGVAYQHIPANRAGRALRNEEGGVQTNRWNVFQIEVCGYANKVKFSQVMADVAEWLHQERGCPLIESVDWLPYDDSYGQTRVRMSYGEWDDYTGHLGHMHAPENDHGDPGWPFPIAQILEGGDELPYSEDELKGFAKSGAAAALNDWDSARPKNLSSDPNNKPLTQTEVQGVWGGGVVGLAKDMEEVKKQLKEILDIVAG